MKFPAPGTVIAIDTGFYQHVGIITDRFQQGRPMVISNLFRRGGVYEESWWDFSGHRHVFEKGYPGQYDASTVLGRARSRIGSRWNLFSWNCEHFVSWAHGLKTHSPQLAAMCSCLFLIAGMAVAHRVSGKMKS